MVGIMKHHRLSSSSSSRKLRSFCKWMQDCGIQYSDALELTNSDDIVSEIGVMALCDLYEGDLIAVIPKKACLTTKTTGAADMIEDAELGGGLGLTVALMYEMSRKEQSPWYDYLQLLPSYQILPIVWSADEIDNYLAGTELHMVVMEDRQLIEKDWYQCIMPLSKHNPYDFPPEYFTLERYFLAKTLVASRAFEVDEYHGFGMIPLADLFNHRTAAEDVHITSVLSDSDSDVQDLCSKQMGLESSSDVEVPLIFGQQSNASTELNRVGRELKEPRSFSECLEGKSDALEVILVKAVANGCEIFNTYGTLSNAALLQKYGFTERGNPYDIINIDFR
eukprot:c19652_g1_i2 orf=481-1488(-)